MFCSVDLRPLDLSVDETMQEILDTIKRIGAKRLVIDSLVGFEMALAPGFRADFGESLYRIIGALTGAGITVLSTVEVEDTFTAFSFTAYTRFEPRNVPISPMPVATMPPMSIQMALSVGEPVKNRDTSEPKEFVALTPMMISTTPQTSSAREPSLFITTFQ